MPEFEERIQQWFLKRTKGSVTGKVLTKGVVARLRSEVINDPVAIRKALLLLRDEGHLVFSADERGTPVSSYISVIKPTADVEEHLQRWSLVLEEKGISQADAGALLSVADAIKDLPKDDMRLLLDGLVKLRHDQLHLLGQPAYIVSAKYLLGSSKMLTRIPRRSLKAYGIEPRQFPSHPLYVVVAGCASPETVVLVENPAAFELAISTQAVNRCAFIATFGFGLSKSEEDCGNQLAKMVEARFSDAITLTREGSMCPTAKELLSHPKITFWGDLDVAGLEIYLRLRKAIPHLQLSALYKPMVASVDKPAASHPYVALAGKERQPTMPRSGKKDDPVLARLLDICVSRGVDQEQVSPSDVESLSPFGLDARHFEEPVYNVSIPTLVKTLEAGDCA